MVAMLKKLSDSFHSLSIWLVSNFDDQRRTNQHQSRHVISSSASTSMLNHYNAHSTSSGNIALNGTAGRQRVVSSDDIHRIATKSSMSTSSSQKKASKIRCGVSFMNGNSAQKTTNGVVRMSSVKKPSATFSIDTNNGHQQHSDDYVVGGEYANELSSSQFTNGNDNYVNNSDDSGVASDLCNNFYRINVSREQFTSTLDELNKNNNNSSATKCAPVAIGEYDNLENMRSTGASTSSSSYHEYVNIAAPSSSTQRPKGSAVHKSNHSSRGADGKSLSMYAAATTFIDDNDDGVRPNGCGVDPRGHQEANHHSHHHNRQAPINSTLIRNGTAAAVVGNNNLLCRTTTEDVNTSYSISAAPTTTSQRGQCERGGETLKNGVSATHESHSHRCGDESKESGDKSTSSFDCQSARSSSSMKDASSDLLNQMQEYVTAKKETTGCVNNNNNLNSIRVTSAKEEAQLRQHSSRSKEPPSFEDKKQQKVPKSPWRIASKIKRRHSASKQAQQQQRQNSLMTTSASVAIESSSKNFGFLTNGRKWNGKNAAVVDDSALLTRSVVSSSGSCDVSQLKRATRPKSEHFSSCQLISTKGGGRGISTDSPTGLFGRRENYEKLEKLGEGSYATVYKGQNVIDGTVVALKEIRINAEEGCPFTAIREASLLKGLKHANIVLLHDIVHTKDSLTFVFEFVHSDLSQYLEKHPTGIHPFNVKLYLFQLLRGLSFCHDKKILHRDIKPQNLLISESGELKLADFGLARAKSVPSHTYSHEVVTLWYRPPDVLLGSTTYSTSLDMWGVGCIFAEMITGNALFPGAKDVFDQLDRIFRLLGTPTDQTWDGVRKLPNYVPRLFSFYAPSSVANISAKVHLISNCEQLLASFLQMNPEKRISARSAMSHPYFSDLPPQLHILPHISSIFIIPGIRMVPEPKTRTSWHQQLAGY